MTDYLEADCIACGRITDVVDGSKDPALCVKCYDGGLSARKVREARVTEARTRKANGASVDDIMASMHVSRATLWRWMKGVK